jgi:hypothetical protein
MAFVTDSLGNVTAFAEYQDVLDKDQRLFENNEGLTDNVINDFLVRSTARVLSAIKYSDWWRDLYLDLVPSPSFTSSTDVPDVDPNKILTHQDDFTDLCVFYALYYYILPKVADFSKNDNAERAKIGFYQERYQFLFTELINVGDWYDMLNDGTIVSKEKKPGSYRLHRTR